MEQFPQEYLHLRAFYVALHEKSTIREDDGLRVFRGKVTDLFKSLKVSQAYYTRIRNGLREMGCIEYLHRGSARVPSTIVIRAEPTFEAWQAWKYDPERHLTADQKYDRLLERVRQLEHLQGKIHTGEVLNQIELRFQKLEEKITQRSI